jgi:hypothetical protein
MAEREHPIETVARLLDENRALRAQLTARVQPKSQRTGRLVPFGLLGLLAITVVFVGSWLCPKQQRDLANESRVHHPQPRAVVQATPTTDSNCDLPFEVDPQGIRRPKVECLRR